MSIETRTIELQIESVASIPYLDQWVGTWAIEPSRMDALILAIQSTDLQLHIAKAGDVTRPRGSAYRMDQDGVALISLEGTLQKHQASMSRATSTVLARRDIRAAMNDDSIGAIQLHIDSPGGTVAGTEELVADIVEAGKRKPVFAHVSDLGASAAYWVASAAHRITATRSSLIGSIGTYAVVSDFSGFAAKEGVKVHVVRAGDFKGAGVPGTEVTAAQLAETQRIVDGLNQLFLDGVASGRKMSIERVKMVADGRVHIAGDAVSLGLIDAVQSFDQAFAAAVQVANKSTPSKRKGSQMSDTTPVTTVSSAVATISQIEAACPGASKDFVINSLKAGRSLEQCRDAFAQELATELATANEQIKSLTAERDEAVKAKDEAESKLKQSTRGVTPLIDSKTTEKVSQDSSASDAFWSAVKDQQSKGMTRAKAIAAVNRQDPSLREAMLESQPA